MKGAIDLTRMLLAAGWRVAVGEGGTPSLVRVGGDAAPLAAAVKGQLAAVRADLVTLHTAHECGRCLALVGDGVAVAAANECGPGAGCPFAHCPYRG